MNYSNEGPALYQRHPVQVSVLNDLKFKYKKAYNYEMENNAYKEALVKTFAIPKKICIHDEEWSVVEPVNLTTSDVIETAYNQALEYIKGKLQTSEYFQLSDNQSVQLNPIQIVHDRLISYQSHKRIPSYILHIQLVLYREAKYQAKDIGMTVRVDKEKGMWRVSVMEAWINGIISEDQIALFPVVAQDPLNTNVDLSTAEFKEPPAYQKLKERDLKFYEICASNNVDPQKQMQCVQAIDYQVIPQQQVSS
jgi:hypothetical protein